MMAPMTADNKSTHRSTIYVGRSAKLHFGTQRKPRRRQIGCFISDRWTIMTRGMRTGSEMNDWRVHVHKKTKNKKERKTVVTYE